MVPTLEALKHWPRDEFGPVLKLDGGYEIRLEPLIFDEQWYLAIYKDLELVVPKVVVKIGKPVEQDYYGNEESGSEEVG